MEQYSPSLEFSFPDNFIFGTSVAAFQVEGNVSGERRTDWDVFLESNHDQIIRPGEVGANWWGDTASLEKDLNEVSKMGVTYQRLSFEWARIEPEKGQINHEAIKRYKFLLDVCKQNGLTPMLTINHFTLPDWAAKKGGWENPQIVDWIENFTSTLLENFPDITYWIIINEPGVMTYLGNLIGIFPPNKKNLLVTLKTRSNIIKAQKRIYKLIKKSIPNSMVGNAFSFLWLRSYDQHSKIERKLAHGLNHLLNTNFISAVINHIDFIGVNYYTGYYVDLKLNYFFPTMRNEASYVPHYLPFSKTIRPKTYRTDMGWPIVPDFFLDLLKHLYEKYKKPIYITENGLADRDDIYRSFYILTHLTALGKAMEQGIDVRGYIHWSTIDNLEWVDGYAKRFGLIGVDPLTGVRRIRDGSKVFAEIVKSKKIKVGKIIEEFVPEEQKAYAHYVVSQLMKSTKDHCPRITKVI